LTAQLLAGIKCLFNPHIHYCLALIEVALSLTVGEAYITISILSSLEGIYKENYNLNTQSSNIKHQYLSWKWLKHINSINLTRFVPAVKDLVCYTAVTAWNRRNSNDSLE
jgi:hypothetical protein